MNKFRWSIVGLIVAEMNSENINALYKFIDDNGTIDYKRDLLRIVGKWKEGNFDNIVRRS
ncbi:DUF6241 domain-containing protein [Peribacillus frigoritolerans]|uniref:DUF6241 domain-containing protein n=1 Tax=Peribacillus frigoritolerans TaxID=450367 RepID=UPI003F83DE35